MQVPRVGWDVGLKEAHLSRDFSCTGRNLLQNEPYWKAKIFSCFQLLLVNRGRVKHSETVCLVRDATPLYEPSPPNRQHTRDVFLSTKQAQWSHTSLPTTNWEPQPTIALWPPSPALGSGAGRSTRSSAGADRNSFPMRPAPMRKLLPWPRAQRQQRG